MTCSVSVIDVPGFVKESEWGRTLPDRGGYGAGSDAPCLFLNEFLAFFVVVHQGFVHGYDNCETILTPFSKQISPLRPPPVSPGPSPRSSFPPFSPIPFYQSQCAMATMRAAGYGYAYVTDGDDFTELSSHWSTVVSEAAVS